MSVLVCLGVIVGAVIALVMGAWIAFWTGTVGLVLFTAYGVGKYNADRRRGEQQ